jgi:hypothetical protein
MIGFVMVFFSWESGLVMPGDRTPAGGLFDGDDDSVLEESLGVPFVGLRIVRSLQGDPAIFRAGPRAGREAADLFALGNRFFECLFRLVISFSIHGFIF